MSADDFRVVVAIDFGTTCSGFAYSHQENQETMVYSLYPGETTPKTNTVLQYDNDWKVESWGYTALVREGSRKKKDTNGLPVELFKLHLADIKPSEKPYLPPGLEYTKAITDFLKQMRPLIEETLITRWPTITMPETRFVFTIPVEWTPKTRGILRECIFNAGYLETKNATNLEFISEPEAAALFCMQITKEHNLKVGDAFMVCDCGGGTVDLTVRTLQPNNRLSEDTQRTGALCGSTYVDREFYSFLGRQLGASAMGKFRANHYGQYQYLIQDFFCRRVKNEFRGDPSLFREVNLDIRRMCPLVMDYVTDQVRERMKDEDWNIEIQYRDVKNMFDPVVDKIIGLVQDQLTAIEGKNNCSALFVVGGFAENRYLVNRLKESFKNRVRTIALPPNPITAVLKGGVCYGLDKKTIKTRVIPWTYGIEVSEVWKSGVDKKKRRTYDGRILKFFRLVQCGTEASTDKKFLGNFVPVYPDQTGIMFKVFATKRNDAKFCDEPGVKLVGNMSIDLPKVGGLNRSVEFGLTFAEEEIHASSFSKRTWEACETTFDYVY